MIDSLEICADIELDDIESAIINMTDGYLIDYIYNEKLCFGQGFKYFLEIKFKSEFSEDIAAEIIYKWLINCYEPFLLNKMYETNFSENICDKVLILNSAKQKNQHDKYNKNIIVKKITKYIDEEKGFIVEGFIRFRLYEYCEEIYMKLCEAIEEFYIEQEYNDFVQILADYVDYKPPRIDLLHIVIDNNGNFVFYDFLKNKIELKIEKESPQNQIEFFLTKDDLLVSILIELSPKRIIWHNINRNENSKILKTIEAVFKERFSLCPGCDLCDTD